MTDHDTRQIRRKVTAILLVVTMVLSVLALGPGTATAFEPDYTISSATGAANPAIDGPNGGDEVAHVYVVELGSADSRTEFTTGDSINISSDNGNGPNIDFSNIGSESASAVEFVKNDGTTVEGTNLDAGTIEVNQGDSNNAIEIVNSGGGLTTTDFDSVKYVRIVVSAGSGNNGLSYNSGTPSVDIRLSITQDGNTVNKTASDVQINTGDNAPVQIDDGNEYSSFVEAVQATSGGSNEDITISGDVNEFESQVGTVNNSLSNNIQTATVQGADLAVNASGNTVNFTELEGSNINTALDFGGNDNVTIQDVTFGQAPESVADLDNAILLGDYSGGDGNVNITSNTFNDFDAASNNAVITSGSNTVSDVQIGASGSGNTFNDQGGDDYAGIYISNTDGEITIEDNTMNGVGDVDFGIRVADMGSSTVANINNSDISTLTDGTGIDVDPSASDARVTLDGNKIGVSRDDGTTNAVQVNVTSTINVNNTNVVGTSGEDVAGIKFTGTVDKGVSEINIAVEGDGSGLTDVQRGIEFDITEPGGGSDVSLTANVTNTQATIHGSGHGIDTTDFNSDAGANLNVDLEVNNFDVTGANGGADGIVVDSSNVNNINFQLDRSRASSSESSSFTDIGGTAVNLNSLNNLQQDTINHTTFTNVNNGLDISAALGSTSRLNISQVDVTLASSGGTGISFTDSSGTNLDLDRIDTAQASGVTDRSNRATTAIVVNDGGGGNVDLNTKSITSGSNTIGGAENGLVLANINKHNTTTLENLAFENIGNSSGGVALDIQNIEQSGSDPDKRLTVDTISVIGNSPNATAIQLREQSSPLNEFIVIDPTLGSTSDGVDKGIDVVSGANTDLTIQSVSATPTINLADAGSAGIDYTAGSNTLDLSPDTTIQGVDAADPAADAILVDGGSALDFGDSDLTGYTFGAVDDGVDLNSGSSLTQSDLNNLVVDNVGSGSALNIQSSVTSLAVDNLTVDDNGDDDATAITVNTGDDLTVTDATLGANNALDTGIQGDDIGNLDVTTADINLAAGGGQGINVDDSSDAGNLNIAGTVTIDGPTPDSSTAHASSGIEYDGNSKVNISDPSSLTVSGVDNGLLIEAASNLENDGETSTPTIDGATFNEIGTGGGIVIQSGNLAGNRIIFDSVTVDFQNDAADASGTGIDLSAGAANDDVELINLDITGDASADGDTGVSIDTNADVLFDGPSASSPSSFANLEEGVQIESAAQLNPTIGGSSVDSDPRNVTQTSFTSIDGSAAIAVNASLSDGDILFDQIDVDSSSSATAIYFEDSSTNLAIEESELGDSARNDVVDLGVDVQGVSTLDVTNANNEIGLADSATGALRVDDSSSSGVVIGDLTIAGASSQTNRAGFGINIVNTGSNGDGTVSIDNATSAQSDISGVDRAIVAQTDTNDLNDITNTTFSDIGDGSNSDDAVINVSEVSIGAGANDDTLTVDNITVDDSQDANATNVDLVSGDSLEVTNSDLGASSGAVYQGVIFGAGGSSSGLTVTNTDIGLADNDGTGVAFKDDGSNNAGDLTLDTVSISGSGSTGILVRGDATTTIDDLDSTIQVDDVDTGIDIQTANNVNGDSITGVTFNNIGSDAAVKIRQDNLASSTFTISQLDIGLADGSGTGIDISTSGSADYDLSNNVVSGTGSGSGTGISIDTGSNVLFDEGVSDENASEISNVDTGVVFTGGSTLNDAGSGAVINFTEFDNIGTKAIDVDSPSSIGSSELAVGSVIVDNSGSATGIEFDDQSDDAIVVENLSVNAGTVQTGVDVEQADAVTVEDSTVVVTDDGNAAGVLVDDSGTPNVNVVIERNLFEADGNSGSAIQLDAIGSAGGHLIFLNDIEGFTADDGFGLEGNDVNRLEEEDAIANYWGSELGPNAENGSDVGLGGVNASEVRIYDPHLTVNTTTLVSNIDDTNAQTLDEVTVDYIRDFAHSMVIEAGDQMVFPGDSARTIGEAYDVKGGDQDTGQQAFEYNATTNSYDPITDNSTAPNAFDDVAFEFEDSTLSATLNVEYQKSGTTVREVEYQEGVNLVSATSATTLNSSLDVENGISVTESDQTYGLNDSQLDLSNVTISTIGAPAGAAYDQDFQDPPVSAALYNQTNQVNGDISPFAVTFVIIDQDESTFDGVTTRTVTPTTMDEVVDRGSNDNSYAFKNETST